jgi:hypothetical protein
VKLNQEVVKYPVGWVLVILLATIAMYLWLIDLFSLQRVFGVLLASELVVFAMLAYVYSKTSFSKVSKTWLLLGSIAVVGFLFLALIIATQ